MVEEHTQLLIQSFEMEFLQALGRVTRFKKTQMFLFTVNEDVFWNC